MSTKNNPGPQSCYEKALPDEPMFTLLGRDPAAPFVVLFWCKMRDLLNETPTEGDIAQIKEAQECSEQMRDWAQKLGKEEKLRVAFQAFRAACFEVARAEFETREVG